MQSSELSIQVHPMTPNNQGWSQELSLSLFHFPFLLSFLAELRLASGNGIRLHRMTNTKKATIKLRSNTKKKATSWRCWTKNRNRETGGECTLAWKKGMKNSTSEFLSPAFSLGSVKFKPITVVTRDHVENPEVFLAWNEKPGKKAWMLKRARRF